MWTVSRGPKPKNSRSRLPSGSRPLSNTVAASSSASSSSGRALHTNVGSSLSRHRCSTPPPSIGVITSKLPREPRRRLWMNPGTPVVRCSIRRKLASSIGAVCHCEGEALSRQKCASAVPERPRTSRWWSSRSLCTSATASKTRSRPNVLECRHRRRSASLSRHRWAMPPPRRGVTISKLPLLPKRPCTIAGTPPASSIGSGAGASSAAGCPPEDDPKLVGLLRWCSPPPARTTISRLAGDP